jgi:hypothetical protein
MWRSRATRGLGDIAAATAATLRKKRETTTSDARARRAGKNRWNREWKARARRRWCRRSEGANDGRMVREGDDDDGEDGDEEGEDDGSNRYRWSLGGEQTARAKSSHAHDGAHVVHDA